jgi:hypothetical protein
MDAGIYEFRWPVRDCGYCWFRGKRGASPDTPIETLPKDRAGGELMLMPAATCAETERFPLKEHSGLFALFAEVQSTADITVFANRYGLLGLSSHGREAVALPPWPHPEPSPLVERSAFQRVLVKADDLARGAFVRCEWFSDWHTEIANMTLAINAWHSVRSWTEGGRIPKPRHWVPTHWKIDDVSTPATVKARGRSLIEELISTVFKEHGVAWTTATVSGGRVHLLPRNLLGAMWLQLADAVAENKELRRCESSTCERKWFVTPDPYGPRADATFCSDPCRHKAYRERKAKARALATRGATPREIAKQVNTEIDTVRGWIGRHVVKARKR